MSSASLTVIDLPSEMNESKKLLNRLNWSEIDFVSFIDTDTLEMSGYTCWKKSTHWEPHVSISRVSSWSRTSSEIRNCVSLSGEREKEETASEYPRIIEEMMTVNILGYTIKFRGEDDAGEVY